ncbi:AAA family ATPase [Halanaerobium saccharolyticum]|uniref:MoxR-like ATPase n=1 Tax=Halanaerobium saccharolyticum TaxID=43595 RepID=A0A2T5RQD3_9FIRM|nr:MoxR family ATPase [Halanaerobium saccharolyticum]PTW02195.1 MoxR-like ATPase [Halanaerobium saccharolyticum]
MQNIEKVQKIIDNVEEVILGKNRVIKLALAAMMAEGHILFEDVPGVGKTILVRSLARSIGCSFKRVQFTPDLLPSDITGVSIYNQKTNEFEFREGPILSQVVLADEINRATPRTQSALLESMAEKQITVEGVSRRLSDPFIVMATQNPIEYDGTFPLPEAQLDRFLIRLEIGYPAEAEEQMILKNLQLEHPVEKLEAVMTDQEFIELQSDVKKVHVDQKLRKYIVELVNQSRSHSDLELGASPRGSIALMKMAQAWAVINERDYIIPDDIKEIAAAVLAHRIIIKSKSRLRGADKEKIVKEIIRRTEVPVID